MQRATRCMRSNESVEQLDPRIIHTREVVLEAARELLIQEGREAVTAVRLADITGVARTTIYRHWPDQNRLLLATIQSCVPDIEFVPTGNLHQDLVTYLEEGNRLHGDVPVEQVFATVLDLADHSEEVARYVREIHEMRAAPVIQMLETAAATGEIRPDLRAEDAVTLIIGPLFFRKLVVGQPITTEYIETVVDQFLRGAAPSV